jgi:hypothetical protein
LLVQTEVTEKEGEQVEYIFQRSCLIDIAEHKEQEEI